MIVINSEWGEAFGWFARPSMIAGFAAASVVEALFGKAGGDSAVGAYVVGLFALAVSLFFYTGVVYGLIRGTRLVAHARRNKSLEKE